MDHDHSLTEGFSKKQSFLNKCAHTFCTSAFATIEDVMGMFSKAFFKKVMFASFVVASLFLTGYPLALVQANSAGAGAPNAGMTSSYQTPTAVAESARQEASTSPDFGCSILNGFDGVGGCALSLFYNIVVIPISWGLGVTALLFNFSFEMSMDAGAANGSSASIFADGFIKIGWLAIRDLINITFIFALLQVAILLIVGKSGGYQDRLKNIIIAAIFINFSYFIVTEAIKLSNAFTRAIYNQIVTQGTGIADGFTTATGISAFGSAKAAISAWAASNPWSLFIYLIFSAILMVVFIGVMLMSTAMFIGRYVVLVLCVVFSPVLFLGLIWPQFGKKTEELKQTLVGQLMFPIIYLLLIWVGLNFINIEKTAQSVLAVTDSKQFLDFGQQVKEIVFRFFVATALFVVALTAAKQYSQMGSKSVSKIQGALGKGIGAVAFGGTAAVGRTFVGGAGGRVLQSAGARLQTIGTGPDSGRFSKFVGAAGGRALGRGVSLAGDKTRSASFDVRSGTVFQAVGNESGASGMYGKAREGGFNKAQEERADNLKKRRDQLKATTAGEAAALNKAQSKQHKDTNAAADEFKAQHGVSLDDHKKNIDELKTGKKDLEMKLKIERDKHGAAMKEFNSIKQAKIDKLEAEKTSITGSNSAADAARRTEISNQLNALKKKRVSSADLAGNAALADLHTQLKDAEQLQAVVETQAKEVRNENQKIYAEISKMADYDAKKKTIDTAFEKTEKSIKAGGKSRAAAFDTSAGVTSNLARQQYFAKLREEAAGAGKKKK